jgi:CRP/FNR family transcriptional regulator
MRNKYFITRDSPPARGMTTVSMKQVSKEEILSRTSLFQNISGESLASLAEICISKNLKKNEMLFHEGEEGLCVYILVFGNVKLYKTGPDGKEVVIKMVKEGEMFAEAILFEHVKYPVNAVSLKTGLAYMLPTHQFTCLFEDPKFRKDFFKMMMQKVRYLANQISYLSSYDVEDRLFLFLEDQFGKRETISLNISKKDVAAAIRTTPETLSRLLLRLKNEEKLTWEGRTITVAPEVWRRIDEVKQA